VANYAHGDQEAYGDAKLLAVVKESMPGLPVIRNRMHEHIPKSRV